MEDFDEWMAFAENVSAESLVPTLYVRDFSEARKYYTKLLFEALWDWGRPPTFGCVRLDKIEIFFCEGDQGHSGTWLWISWTTWTTIASGSRSSGPTSSCRLPTGLGVCASSTSAIPTGMSTALGMASRPASRRWKSSAVPLKARIEKRLAAVIEDVARRNNVTLGEMLEETSSAQLRAAVRRAAWPARTRRPPTGTFSSFATSTGSNTTAMPTIDSWKKAAAVKNKATNEGRNEREASCGRGGVRPQLPQKARITMKVHHTAMHPS